MALIRAVGAILGGLLGVIVGAGISELIFSPLYPLGLVPFGIVGAIGGAALVPDIIKRLMG